MDDYEEKLIRRYTNKYELPTILYHYTIQEGLLGILNSSTIRATDILYLNDKAEFAYSANAIESEIRKIIKSWKEPITRSTKKIFEEMLDQTKILDDFQIFICSFSVNGNLLSQWRGYCPDNNGFSIGFDYLKLKDIAKTQKFIKFYLLPCFYEKDEQESIIKELRNEVFRNIASCMEKNSYDDLDKIIEDYTYKYLLISAILKDKSFSEEKEWRLISLKYNSDRNPEIQFRKGASMILPYLSIELQKNAYGIPISQIYIGPTPHNELSRKSVELLLKSKRVKCVVKDCEIPYRAW